MITTQEEIKNLVHYDKDTGKMTWRENRSSRARKGNEVGCIDKTNKYRVFNYNYKNHLVHRMAWLYVTGELPEQIDHINGDPSDNRFENLRNVSPEINQRNKKLPSHNTSGYLGVYRDSSGSWYAQIRLKGNKGKYVGTFDTPEEASIARKEALKQLSGYHENHGRCVS